MIEEIKEDNNCIVKAFENNPIAILQEDNEHKKMYFFKAADIGKALGIVNIHSTIQNYEDSDERVIRKAYDTEKRIQDTTFLTSQGVYRLLYNSKKEIAKKFRKWAGNILDDIIFNESVELKKQLEEHKKLLEEKSLENIKDKEEILLQNYKNKSIVYLILIKDNLYKFGWSNEIQERFKTHKKEISENITLIYCIESNNNILLEQKLKDYLKTIKNRKSQIFNNKNQTELIEINDISIIKNKLEKFNKPINENLEILKTQEHILELKIELEKLKNERLNDKYKQKAHILLDQEEQELKIEQELLNKEHELLPENTIEELKIEQELLNKEHEEIELLPENTIEELKFKKLKLENNKKYYEKNKDTILENRKEYIKKNKEIIAERNKKYREKNKEKLEEKNKEYREKNKEKIAKQKNEYYKKIKKNLQNE